MSFSHLLSTRTQGMGAGASEIRKMAGIIMQPDIISMAGGFPAPESFPIQILKEMSQSVLDKFSAHALQYGLSEGFPPLREILAKMVSGKNIRASAEDVIITSGSQGTLDSVAKILINRGDKIAVEAPTYPGAVQAFAPYEPQFVSVAMDEQGVNPDSLKKVLETEDIKFIYLVPTFQNPTGRTISLERRKKIAELIVEKNCLVLEDDPYSELRYRGQDIPPIKTFAPEHVIYTNSFSKILAPGLRIGFCIAPAEIKKWLVLAKQGVDLHASTFNMALTAEYILDGHLQKHLPKIIGLYQPRLKTMLESIESTFPDNYNWSKPEGGMFVWVEGPDGTDMEKIFLKAVEKKIAFVPGKFFFTQPGKGKETMRLNFTMLDNEKIKKAVGTLADCLKKACV